MPACRAASSTQFCAASAARPVLNAVIVVLFIVTSIIGALLYPQYRLDIITTLKGFMWIFAAPATLSRSRNISRRSVAELTSGLLVLLAAATSPVNTMSCGAEMFDLDLGFSWSGSASWLAASLNNIKGFRSPENIALLSYSRSCSASSIPPASMRGMRRSNIIRWSGIPIADQPRSPRPRRSRGMAGS